MLRSCSVALLSVPIPSGDWVHVTIRIIKLQNITYNRRGNGCIPFSLLEEVTIGVKR